MKLVTHQSTPLCNSLASQLASSDVINHRLHTQESVRLGKSRVFHIMQHSHYTVVRPPSATFGLMSSVDTQPRTQSEQQPLVSHYLPRVHCIQQLGHISGWRTHINRQCAYQERTRVCSAHWSWNVSYTQRIKSFHLQQKESTSWINMQGVGTTSHYTINKTGYCPSIINDQLESGQSTSHCNLAIQLQCYHVKGHIDNSHVTNFKL